MTKPKKRDAPHFHGGWGHIAIQQLNHLGVLGAPFGQLKIQMLQRGPIGVADLNRQIVHGFEEGFGVLMGQVQQFFHDNARRKTTSLSNLDKILKPHFIDS